MAVRRFIIKALCVTICLAYSQSNEETAREFIEHILRIPNPDKILNSARGRLERSRQQEMRQRVTSDADCEDPTELLPEYTATLQGTRELRQLGQVGSEYINELLYSSSTTNWLSIGRQYHSPKSPGGKEVELHNVVYLIQKHYPICHLERKIKRLNTNEYEYRPAYYEEVRCTMWSNEDIGDTNEICSSLGFACVQWNKTIHLTRRRYNSDCWETSTMVIPAGCECMWPVHRLGDMKLRV